MKELKEISWNVTEEEYRSDPSYSYSTIAKYEREGFEKLDSLFDKVESPSLLFGSIVDTLLTDGVEAFEKLFYVANFEEPSDKIKAIVKAAISYDSSVSIDNIPDSFLIELSEQYGYCLHWKPETRAKVLKKEGSTYFSLLKDAKDKKLVPLQVYQDALECVELLKTSPNTASYFKTSTPFDNKDVVNYFQLKFKGSHNNIPLRIMADIIQVDYVNKTIQPIDLKTSYKKEYNFYQSFVQWGYAHQAQLYAEIIKQNIMQDDFFKGFKILPYLFVVISNNSKIPLVWLFEDTFNTTEKTYGTKNPITIRNWRTIVTELDYYLKNPNDVPIGITKEIPNSITYWLNNL